MRVDLRLRLVAYTLAVVFLTAAGTLYLVATTATAYSPVDAAAEANRDDAIHDRLLAWGFSHRDWRGVEPEVQAMAKEYGRRIVLMTLDGASIADTGPATADPLDTEVLDPVRAAVSDGDVGRLVGPYALTVQERARLGGLASEAVRCATAGHRQVRVVLWASGRPVVVGDAGGCDRALAKPTAGEQRALDQLRGLVDSCLLAAGAPSVDAVRFAGGAAAANGIAFETRRGGIALGGPDDTRCLTAARLDQARTATAPAIRLGISPVVTASAPLTPGSIVRIGLTGGLIVVLIVGGVLLVSAPTRRRIRDLIRAARELTDGRPAAVAIGGGDDVALLGAAFNRLSERLSESERQRRQLIADTAHELRTPLTTIRLWLEAAGDGVITDDADLRTSLDEESAHLQRIVHDLQDLAMADAGELHLDQADVDLSSLLRTAVDTHQARARVADVALQGEIQSGLRTTGDARRLRQVLDNLITNALTHAPARTVVVRAGEADRLITIVVEDTGTGIEPRDLVHVFDRFWRKDPARTRSPGGSGLGLAITRELVEAHHGTITAASSPGTGTRMTVTLPARAPLAKTGIATLGSSGGPV